jgi:hypothetical protein
VCCKFASRRKKPAANGFSGLFISDVLILSINHEVRTMRANQRFLIFVAITTVLIVISGCGGSASLSFPPPQGGFTNSNFTGPFAFSYTGTDGGFLAVAGSFQADGAGKISSGTQDTNSGLGITTNVAITGTYTVRADGRGTINLTSPAGNSTLDFVLVAGGHALVTRFDGNATGSGTIDQQTTSAFTNAALAGSYAFNLSGIDNIGNPLGVAGNFTSDASGNITGVTDSNDTGSVVANIAMTGTMPVAASGRGTATINAIRGQVLTFAYYVVDNTHLKMVETDATFALGGEAFRQTGPFSAASVSGPFAFTIAGVDLLTAGPFAAGGILTSDGAGNISSGTEDFNDDGTILQNVGLTGSYTMAASGRGTLTINTTQGTFTFVIYPTSGGVLALETDVTFLAGGTALQQQTTAFTAGTFSGIYGLNYTAVDPASGAELDSVAEFTADGTSKLSGIVDLNNNGAITFGQPLTGTYTISGNGRTVVPLQTSIGTQNMVVYMVNPNRALFIELDTDLVAAGDIRHQ